MACLYNFQNKHILIVGAAAGIGLTLSIQLARAGAKLSLLDKNEVSINRTKEQLPGVGHHAEFADMNQVKTLAEIVMKLISINGPLDGFVYCVGTRSRRPINMIRPDQVEQIMRINFVSFLEIMRIVVKKGNFNAGLSIVAISSIAAHRGGMGVTAYAASKAALEAAIRCLGRELAVNRIRVNTVVPGQIDTPAYKELMEMSSSGTDPVIGRQYLGLGKPEDVTNLITFLLSNNSGLISGQALPVDGGFLSS